MGVRKDNMKNSRLSDLDLICIQSLNPPNNTNDQDDLLAEIIIIGFGN